VTSLDAQAAFITRAQTACRKARESGKNADLVAAAALLDSADYNALPAEAQEDLGAAYVAAMSKCVGGFA
jgi:hypothetical protein